MRCLIRRSQARDAGTGKFVTKDYAKSHPKTTVVEKVKVGPLFKLSAYVCLVLSQKKIKFATENDVKSYASY